MANAEGMFSSCSKCEACAIHHRAICHSAEAEDLAELTRIAHVRQFERGQIIQPQDAPTELVGNVVEGVVRLVTTSAEGTQHIVGLLFPSDFMGHPFRGDSKFAYEAATDARICCITRSAFEQYLLDHPRVEHSLLVAKLDELDALREWNFIVTGHTAMQRLATFLFILSKRSSNRLCKANEPEKTIISVPISRRDMADYLGTTPETISRCIQTLSRHKVLRIIDAKHFELLSAERLAAEAGQTAEDLLRIAASGNPFDSEH